MKVFAEEKIVQTKMVEKRVECDKCGNPNIGTESIYDVFSCELEIKIGSHYPESRDVEVTAMDLCQSCAEDLKSLLVTAGYRLNMSKEY